MTVFLVTIATIICTTLGGLFAIRFKDKLHLILGFSAGAVLGVALFDLLPESIELTSGMYNVQTVTILIAAGFSTFMLIDRLLSLHGHHDDDCENPSHNGKFGALALIFHSCLDGFGIGLAFKVSPAIGWVVALAVLAHDFSDGINTVNMIMKNTLDLHKTSHRPDTFSTDPEAVLSERGEPIGSSNKEKQVLNGNGVSGDAGILRKSSIGGRKSALRWLMADALAPAIGVSAAYFLTVSKSTLGLLLSVFVGLFLYISASDLIPESHHRHPAIWTSISTIIGMAVIFAAVYLAK